MPTNSSAPNSPASAAQRAPLLAVLALAVAGAFIVRTTPQGPVANTALSALADANSSTSATSQATMPVALTASAETSTLSPQMRRDVEVVIKDYLMKNPEVMVEVQSALEAKMEKIQSEKMAGALKENAHELYQSASAPVAGNLKGDVTVVEIF